MIHYLEFFTLNKMSCIQNLLYIFYFLERKVKLEIFFLMKKRVYTRIMVQVLEVGERKL